MAILYFERTGFVAESMSTTSLASVGVTTVLARWWALALFDASCWYRVAASTTVATAKAAASFSS